MSEESASVIGLGGYYLWNVSSKAAMWLREMWVPFSMSALEKAEKALFGLVKSSVRFQFVPVLNDKCHLRTVSVRNPDADADYETRTPLVLMHSFAGGSALWVRNLDALANARPVYAVDLLGFGRSSRPHFSTDELIAEQFWVESLEDWRRYMKLDKFILMGHSLGAYLSASYALEYADFVSHLVLAEPWGFAVKPVDHKSAMSSTVPTWIQILGQLFGQFSPLNLLRVAGPFGPYLIRKLRPDIGKKYFDDQERQELIFDYIYHCNAQPASGEQGFQAISVPVAWAKRPMVERLPLIRRNFPISFIYGSRSWIDPDPGYTVQKLLRHRCAVRVEIIRGSGHYVYADQADVFNQLVVEILNS